MATTAEWPEPPGSTTVPPPPPPELDDELEPPEEEPQEDELSATAAALAAASALALAAAAALASRSAISFLSPPAVPSSWAWSESTCVLALLALGDQPGRRLAVGLERDAPVVDLLAVHVGACAVLASFSVMRCITSSCVSRSSKVRDAKTTSRMPALSALYTCVARAVRCSLATSSLYSATLSR